MRDIVRSADFADANVARAVADELMEDRYIYVEGLGWLGWTGKLWAKATETEVTEALCQYFVEQFTEAAEALKRDESTKGAVEGWYRFLGRTRISAVRDLVKGKVERKVTELDPEKDWINTQTCVVDLQTGETFPHDPSFLMASTTQGGYRKGYTHPDWDKALTALPQMDADYFQERIGQAITGHPAPDGRIPFLRGGGENGKSALTTDGLVPALGDYASMASAKLFQSSKGTEHSTEMADLRGKRLVIAEELTEGRAIDVTSIKRIADVGMITARYIRQDNITFEASHSLMITTNYTPTVNETDHGTWRRLEMIEFPYTFRKSKDEIVTENDRLGDPLLKRRIKDNASGQWDAIVTWAINGGILYYDTVALQPELALGPPPNVVRATNAWRADADRILGFWQECVQEAPGWAMLTVEALNLFNQWLHENGHKPWSKETFVPRFAQHHETIRRGVVQKNALTRDLEFDRVEPERDHCGFREALIPVPTRARCFIGLRKQSVFDKEEYPF